MMVASETADNGSKFDKELIKQSSATKKNILAKTLP